MPIYSEEDMANAGRQIATLLRQQHDRIQQLEGKPAVDAMQEEWSAGRELARRKGYGPDDLNRLETEMVSRGVARHADMLRLDSTPPSGRGYFLNNLPRDELDMLMSGDDNGYLSLATARARNGE